MNGDTTISSNHLFKPFRKNRVLIYLIPSAFGALVWMAAMGDIFIDDAFITFSNARTFASGHGLYLEPGNRSESASSLPWALLLSIFANTDFFLPFVPKLLGFVFYVGSLLLLIKYTIHVFDPVESESNEYNIPILKTVCICIVLCASFGIWSFYGMENPLVCFLLHWTLCAFTSVEKTRPTVFNQVSVVVPLSLLYISRPETFGFVIIFALWDIVISIARNGLLHAAKRWFGVLCIVGIYELIGFIYYGNWLPTTAMAKTGVYPLTALIKNGSRYLFWSTHLFATGILIFGAATGILYIGYPVRTSVKKNDAHHLPARLFSETASSMKQRHFLLLVLLLLGEIVFITFSGGDWMPIGRLASHFMPLSVLVLVVGAHEFQKRIHFKLLTPFRYRVVLGLFIFSQVVALYVWWPRIQTLFKADNHVLEGIADRLNQCPDADSSVLAVSDIGRLSWRFRGQIFDWWGLADVAVTQRKESLGRIRPETVLQRKPDFIVLYSNHSTLSQSATKTGMAKTSAPFLMNDQFAALYHPIFSLKYASERWHVVFEKSTRPKCEIYGKH